MNELPPKYVEAVRESTGSTTAMLTGTEYLERLFASRVEDRVHIEGGSWTNNISLGTRLRCVIPRERASSRCQYLQNTRIIEVLGTGYYHPVLPLIRPPDREEHLHRWRTIAGYLFVREHFPGFWPPELGFSMDLVPALRRHRYRYVIVDSEHVAALTPMRWEELRYRPHLAQFGGEQIVVVVRDRDLSNAQESGMDPDWFISEVKARTQYCNFPPLVTTATNGENGGWFRNTTPGSNFWSGFHSGLMEKVRAGRAGGIRPTFISEYLARHGPHGWVTVEPGAWNAGSGFVQWTGSPAQQQALTRVGELSEAVHAARRNAIAIGAGSPDLYRRLEDALAMVLRAEASCNFFWGEAWVQRCHDDLDHATRHLEQAERLFYRGGRGLCSGWHRDAEARTGADQLVERTQLHGAGKQRLAKGVPPVRHGRLLVAVAGQRSVADALASSVVVCGRKRSLSGARARSWSRLVGRRPRNRCGSGLATDRQFPMRRAGRELTLIVRVAAHATARSRMSAYVVLMQQVEDVDRYRNEYLPALRPFLQKYGAEVLVAGFEAEPAEGEPPNSTVVIRFADAAAAWALLNDPVYRPVKEIRFSITSRGQMVVAPEFTPAA